MTDHHATLMATRQLRLVAWRWQCAAIVALIGSLTLTFAAIDVLPGNGAAFIAIWAAATVPFVVVEHRRRRTKANQELELVSLHAVALADARRRGPERVVVHRTGPDPTALAGVAVIAALFVGAALLRNSPGGWITPTAFGIAVLLTGPHQPIGRSPLIVLDRNDIEFTHLRVTLPWSAFGHAHVVSGPTGAPVVRWQVLDPELAMAQSQLGGFRRRRALKRIRNAGGTIDIPSGWMREPPEVVLAASWRLAGEYRTGVLD